MREQNYENQEESIKYAQQHLANERTYLAWIRTAVSVIGVGFLTTSLHYTIRITTDRLTDVLAIFLGLFACLIGIITGILSTIQYSRNRKAIINGHFCSSNYSILFLSILFSGLILIIFIYLSSLLFVTR